MIPNSATPLSLEREILCIIAKGWDGTLSSFATAAKCWNDASRRSKTLTSTVLFDVQAPFACPDTD